MRRRGKYERAERSEAEEAYGDYVDVVEAATEALAEMRYRFREHTRRSERARSTRRRSIAR